MSRRVWLVLLIVLLPVASTAVPVTYEFSAGTLTSVRMDATTGGPTNCPIQGSVSCLTNGTIELTGSIVYDDETGLVSNLEFSLIDTAVLDVGFAGMQQITLADFGYDSGGGPAFVTMFGFQVLGGAFTTTLAVDDGSGNLTVVADEEIAAATLSLVDVDETTLQMDLSSAGLGTVCAPSDPDSCVVMEADFGFTAQVAALDVVFSTSDGTATIQPSVVVAGTVNHGDATIDVDGVSATLNGLVWSATVPVDPGSNVLVATAIRGAESAEAAITVVRTATAPPPAPTPQPSVVDITTVTNLAEATSFLYTGAGAIQTGVSPSTIDPIRAGVVRGRVLTNGGEGLPSVRVTVEGHPELGETLTQPLGQFDLAVNAGGTVDLLFEREGYIPVRRQARVEWNDFDVLPDLVMVPRTATASSLALGSGGTILLDAVDDALGARQPVMLFPPQTSVTVVGGGSLDPQTPVTIRVTELTAGPGAKARLPADVPAGIDARWVFDFSIDQAQDQGVVFSQPVELYFEDPAPDTTVGQPIGFAMYDPAVGAWVPEAGSQVVEVFDDGGVLRIDTDGDGDVDQDDTVSAADGEAIVLAGNYPAQTKLRRYVVPHFSPGCGHGKPVFPMGARTPSQKDAQPPDGQDDCDCDKGSSIVRVERQVWAEAVDVVGSPYDLHFESDRTPGYLAGNSLTIPLTGSTLPGPVEAVHLEVEVAGQRFAHEFPPFTDMSHTFTWDGKDAYGRTLQGRQKAHVRIDYEYTGSIDGLTTKLRKTQRYTSRVGPWDARGVGLGGWTLSPHHTYDPDGKILFRGDGRRRSGGELPPIAKLWAGSTDSGIGAPDGSSSGKATQYDFASQWTAPDVAVGPDGAMYVPLNFLTNGFSIFKVDRAGDINFFDFVGTAQGQPAAAEARGLAVDDQGNVYVSDPGVDVVWKITPNGVKSVAAGVVSTTGNGPDGVAATSTHLTNPQGIALGPDGSLYIADQGNHVVRRVRPDGIAIVVAGDGGNGLAGVPGPATSASIGAPSHVAVGVEGELYVSYLGNRVFRVSTDGTIDFFAGNGQLAPATGQDIGDGGPALDAFIAAPNGLAVGSDGSVYVSAGQNSGASFVVWRIRPDGLAQIVAGTTTPNFLSTVDIENGRPAKDEEMGPTGLAVFPDGALAVADYNSDILRSYFWRIEPPLPGRSVGDFLVVSQNGSEVYEFDPNGRHLKTFDSLTGATLHEFGYTNGKLSSITDVDLDVTAIQHTSGQVQISPPFGPPTTISLDANDFASSITNPEGESHAIAAQTNGLIDVFTKPDVAAFQLSYDSLGRLLLDEDPEGGFFAYERIQDANGRTIISSRPSGKTKSVSVDHDPKGDVIETRVGFDGFVTQRTMTAAGEDKTVSPDGTTVIRKVGPDPRFGLAAPVTESLEILTGTRAFKRVQERTVTFNGSQLGSQTDEITINDRTTHTLVSYDGTTREVTTTTEEGRELVEVLDAQGRIEQTELVGLEPVRIGYDTHGRVDSLSQGIGSAERLVQFMYDADGNVEHVTDPLPRTVSFVYDDAGRVTRQILPDSRFVDFTYDGRGNLTSLTPPGQSPHIFLYTGLDQEREYAPPVLGQADPRTFFTYDLDRNLDFVLRPDSSTIDPEYELATGRLKTIEIPRGMYTFGYDLVTGQLSAIDAPGGQQLTPLYDGALPRGSIWSGAVAGSVEHNYDNEFRIDSQTVNSGFAETFVYDNDGLLTWAGMLHITPDSDHGITRSTQLIDGVTIDTAITPNDFGETKDDSAFVSGVRVYFNDYTRDDLGRIIGKAEEINVPAQVTSIDYGYGYDTAGRLETVTIDDGTTVTTRVYGYDSNGNRQTLTENGVLLASGVADSQDRLTSYGANTFDYDDAGDLFRKTVGSDVTSYAYDALGNLTHVTLPDLTAIDYVIDGLNRRVGKKVGGNLVKGWLYQDQLNPVAELDGSGNVTARFVYGTKPNVPDYMIKGGVTYRILSDHLGSPRLVVNASSGVVVQLIDYDEFGRVLQDSNPGFQPFGFAGGLYDADTGLVRFGARDYDAEIGRWTTKDPIRFDASGTNLYGYSLADPISHRDLNGLDVGNTSPVGVYVLGGGKNDAYFGFGGDDGAVRCCCPGKTDTGSHDAVRVPGQSTVFKTPDFSSVRVTPGPVVAVVPSGPVSATIIGAAGGGPLSQDEATRQGFGALFDPDRLPACTCQ